MAILKDLIVQSTARILGVIYGNSFVKDGGTSSQFLKADGSVDSNSYSLASHNHDGVYKPVQSAVSDPSASETTSTTFIDTITQNANGVITATKKTIPSELPSISGNSGKVLAVNSGATGVEWITSSGGPINYDFTVITAPAITNQSTTLTFVANQRNCVEFSTDADLSIELVCNNKSDNYIWVANTHNSDDIDVVFSNIYFGQTNISVVKGLDSLPSIKSGETLEIGVYVDDTKARITSVIL